MVARPPVCLDTFPELCTVVELAHRANINRPRACFLRCQLDGKVAVIAENIPVLKPSCPTSGRRKTLNVVFSRLKIVLERGAERRLWRGCLELDFYRARARTRGDFASGILRCPRRI